MSYAHLVAWVKGKASEGITSFALPLNGDADGDKGRAVAFVPNEVYLEVRVRQIWLTQEREMWREFQPFAAVVSEFLHRGETRTLPAILGASALGAKLSLIRAEDAIEIRNLRVAGPTPYEGDDVSVLVALFRTETKDWMGCTLGIVESIAQAVGGPALVAAKSVADAVVSAVTQILGQDDVELRCGQHHSWSSPEDPERPGSTELQPMHYVVMRCPVHEAGADPGVGFTVHEGRLHRRNDEGVQPYTEHDFILLSIESRRLRNDYKKLRFYGLWQQTQAHVLDGDLVAAERSWRRTVGALYTDELTGMHQQTLYAEYNKRYREMLDRFAQADDHAFRGGRVQPVSMPIDEQDPAEILLAQVQ